MGHKKPSLFIGLCILVTSVSSQHGFTTQRPDTDKCCLREVAKDTIDLINYGNVTNEAECTKLCNNRQTCVGVNWRSNSGYHGNECKLFATFNNVKHWILLNCADGNLSYCWELKVDVHQKGGHLTDITNEVDCKQRCIGNWSCTGVDWNLQLGQCWMLLPSSDSTIRGHGHRINHWLIVRNVPRTCQNNNNSIQTVLESTTESSGLCIDSTMAITSFNLQGMPTLITLVVLLGIWTLIIIGISIYALKLKKCCSTQKKVDKVKVVDVAKVVEAKVNDYGEAKEDDDESYIDYQDLRRLENPPTTCEEEGCEYTAMELENMKEMEDDDNIYYNEDQ